MKIQKIFLLLAWMLVSALFASCAQLTNNTATSTLTITSISYTKTLAPTLTLTPVSTYTPVAAPTLSVEHARARLLELLANNGNCRLPCLWGITPGKSSYQEAQAVLVPLTSISNRTSFRSESGTISPLYAEDNLGLFTDAGFLSTNHVVNHLVLDAREEKQMITTNGIFGNGGIFDSTTFGKRIEYYSLAHVLSEQGIPDSVIIATTGSRQIPVAAGGFYIALFYPDQGIWVKYTTSMHLAGNIVRGCLENAHVEMELYPPGNADSFQTLLEQARPEMSVQKDWYKPLERVTSMTLEQFYETFRQPTDKCIETPAKLWLTPEAGGG